MTEKREFHPLTVAEFIAQLQQFSPDCRVMVKGYESGLDDPETPVLTYAKIDPYDSSVYGDYEEVDGHSDEGAFPVVFIDRRT
jgi:hypothetical protein